MKHCLVLPLLFSTILIHTPADASVPDSFLNRQVVIPYFSIKLSGGLSQWLGGEYQNKYDERSEISDIEKFEGDKFGWQKDVGLEVRYQFHPDYGLSISLEYAKGNSFFNWEYYYYNETPITTRESQMAETVDMDASLIPIYLTLYRNWYYQSPNIKSSFGIEAGYYFSSCTSRGNF